MIDMKRVLNKKVLIVSLAAVTVFGCGKPLTRTQKGAAIGTAGGAAAGAIVGKVAGNAALGAIIGAAVGGASGAVIGHKMDKQAKEIERQVPNADVQRTGEGIVVTFNSSVLFGFDRSDLTAQAKTTIDDLYSVLQKYPGENVLIIGHTDDVGSDSYNQDLSVRRASSTANYLVSKGIGAGRVSTKGMGETDPKVANDSEAHRAENRRVEFVLTANEEMKQAAEQEAKS